MSQPWTTLFMLNRQILLERNLADVTQSQADQPPSAGVNSITWILRHILHYRRELLGDVLKSAYRSTAPEPTTLAQFEEAMEETQAALHEAFESADWSAPRFHPAFQASVPLSLIVGTLFMHEAYHLGQLGTTRKLLGLPGAIQPPPAVKA
ncbi:MAG TPA: DinB family protein [Holophagaceae bacterium]|nr:DinB family protein [Holophagaceae bacterium]